MNLDDFPRLPIGEWLADALDWLGETLDWLFDFLSFIINFLVEGLGDALIAVPYPVLIAVLALIAWLVRSWQLAIGTAITMLVIVGMHQWENAMLTLSLVLIATLVAVAIGVPLGILAARRDGFSKFIKPVLDFMQTMPAMVYLIPAVVFFNVGIVPGVFATVLFALAPGVRFTELGIRGVDEEVVEAGYAFGSKPGAILRNIQLPLAMPTIMAGINQVIMLSLSMAVIAGMAGANGLGKEVVAAIATLTLGQGIEAGLGVVILAVFLDRVTAALGEPKRYQQSLISVLRKSKARSATSAVSAESPEMADAS